MKIYTILFFLVSCLYFAQETPKDSLRESKIVVDSVALVKPTIGKDVEKEIQQVNAPITNFKPVQLNPTKAGLYSAVLPGLGQVYNKKYWKIPIVWGAVGAGVGIALWNDKKYKEYRGYYIDKLNGTPNDFLDRHPNLDKVALGNAQDRMKRQRDYAIAGTALVYLLNVIDAVVDAHLQEGRRDPDLAIKPTIFTEGAGMQASNAGISLSYKF